MIDVTIDFRDRSSTVSTNSAGALQRRWGSRAPTIMILAGATTVAGFVVVTGGAAVLLFVAALGAFLATVALLSPVAATALLLLLTFLRSALPTVGPVDPFLVAFALLLVSVALWVSARPSERIPVPGAVELFAGLYILWNLASMFAVHRYRPMMPWFTSEVPVERMVVIGIIMPFALYVIGRVLAEWEGAVRAVLWCFLLAGAYSAAISILQFYGPKSLIWPRYVVDDPKWVGRAVGIFNQPVVNGLTLVLGFVVAVLLASRPEEPRFRRMLATITAVGCAIGVYLTHTRAAYLGFAAVVLLGIVLARGFRRAFVTAAALMALGIATTWSTFVSADREAGGVGSPDEVDDRLNTLATSVWAAEREPWTGWGLGRFAVVNTHHHQQWAPDVPWERGFGIASHLNELGILAELGVVGLVLWLCALGALFVKVTGAVRTLPDSTLCGRPLAVVALLSLVALVVTGLTVDLRLFDFPNSAVLLIVGLAVGAADHARRVNTPPPAEKAVAQ